jgi:hypothetical protein
MAKQRAVFPQRIVANNVGQTGMDTVASITNDQLNWIFRQTHQESDYGIDGYLDVVLENGSVTGQSIAVQIKTGESFFKTKTSAGYVFYGEGKHLNYYLNHATPVIFIICNPKSLECYWEHFKVEKTERTGTRWKMVIPFTNRFKGESKLFLVALVGPATDHSEALQRHWAFTEALQKLDRIMVVVTREQVEALDMQPLLNFFDRLTANPTTCIKIQGKVILAISGYDKDTRELWEIPEVRLWFAHANQIVNVWFFFLSVYEGVISSLNLLLACICDVERISISCGMQKIEIKYDEVLFPDFIERNFRGLNELTERLGIDDRNEEITDRVMKAMGLPLEEKNPI